MNQDLMPSGAWIARASTAERVQDGPTSGLQLLVDGEQSGGALTINRAVLEPGSPGAPAHSHTRTTEAIFVVDGSLDVLLGEQVVTLGAGDLVVVPPAIVHAFAPSTGSGADMLAIFTPGQERFAYYRLLEQLYRGSATLDDLAANADRFDNQYAVSDIWAQHVAR